MKKILKIVTLFFLGIMALSPYFVNAKIDTGGSKLLENTADKAGYEASATTKTTLAENVGQILKFAMSFLGIIFTVLMVYGGFLWMTARGDSDQVDRAQKIISQSVIGLIIVVASYSISAYIVNFVFTGSAP